MTQTVRIPHTIELVTEFNTAHPTVMRMLALPEGVLQQMLVDTFISLVKSEGFFDHVNDNNKYATLKFAKDVEDDSSK
jgi:hypothetical protein